MIRTRLFNSSSWQRKKRATTPPKSPGVTSRISRLLPWTHAYAEDQKRINTFSKLNTRLRGIEDRLAALTVSTDPRAAHAVSPVRQQEKEALDDLATELELADEDQIVPYVLRPRHTPYPSRTQIQDRRIVPPSASGPGPETTRKGPGRHRGAAVRPVRHRRGVREGDEGAQGGAVRQVWPCHQPRRVDLYISH